MTENDVMAIIAIGSIAVFVIGITMAGLPDVIKAIKGNKEK